MFPSIFNLSCFLLAIFFLKQRPLTPLRKFTVLPQSSSHVLLVYRNRYPAQLALIVRNTVNYKIVFPISHFFFFFCFFFFVTHTKLFSHDSGYQSPYALSRLNDQGSCHADSRNVRAKFKVYRNTFLTFSLP